MWHVEVLIFQNKRSGGQARQTGDSFPGLRLLHVLVVLLTLRMHQSYGPYPFKDIAIEYTTMARLYVARTSISREVRLKQRRGLL